MDYRGKYEKDDLGFTRYLDADYVHATFIDKLRDMITSEDMIPLMQELEKNKPWVKQVTKLLQGDETLFSLPRLQKGLYALLDSEEKDDA